MVLGEHLRSDWLPDDNAAQRGDTLKRMSGTSTATPLAVAIAANLIHYADNINLIDENLLTKGKLRSTNGVHAMFKLPRMKTRNGWLTPWRVFEDMKDVAIAESMKRELKHSC